MNDYLRQFKACTIHPHQEGCATKVCDGIERGVLTTLIKAPPQCGKTGCSIACVKILMERGIVEPSNILIISSLNDSEWKPQMRSRFPRFLAKNIFKRSDFSRAVKIYKGMPEDRKKLVIIDEPHYGAGDTQLLNVEFFKKIGINNIEDRENQQLLVIEISATHDEAENEVMLYPPQLYDIVYMEVPGNYMGFDEIDIRDMSDLPNDDKEIEDTLEVYSTPKYHIVRVHDDSQCFFQAYSGTQYEFEFIDVGIKYMRPSVCLDMLNIEPKKHTVFLIRGCFRCSTTLPKRYLGIMIDYVGSTVCDTVIVQSLAGRALGYAIGDNRIYYDNPIVYTNKESTDKYIEGNDPTWIGIQRDRYNNNTFNHLTDNNTVQIRKIESHEISESINNHRGSSKIFHKEMEKAISNKLFNGKKKLLTRYDIGQYIKPRQGSSYRLIYEKDGYEKSEYNPTNNGFHVVPIYREMNPRTLYFAVHYIQ
jgi:hypothetical protein